MEKEKLKIFVFSVQGCLNVESKKLLEELDELHRPIYDSDVDAKGARRLYRKIIFQHLEDLFKHPQSDEHREAKQWINGNGEFALDFTTACDYADWLAEQIRYIAELIITGKLTKKEYKRITEPKGGYHENTKNN